MPHGFCVGRQLSRGRGGRRTFSCARPFVELEAHRCVVRGNGLRLLLSLLLSPLQFSLQLPHPGLGRQPAFLGLCLCFLGCICLCPFSLEGGISRPVSGSHSPVAEVPFEFLHSLFGRIVPSLFLLGLVLCVFAIGGLLQPDGYSLS